MTEAERRALICAEARSWVGTPYRHMGRIKGRKGGVDCAMLVAEVFERAGMVDHVEIDQYPPDWYLHRGTERYLGHVMGRAQEIPLAAVAPGDVALFQVGRCFAHGAIILAPGWPVIVHALKEAGSVILDRGDGGRLSGRPVRFFSSFFPASAEAAP